MNDFASGTEVLPRAPRGSSLRRLPASGVQGFRGKQGELVYKFRNMAGVNKVECCFVLPDAKI